MNRVLEPFADVGRALVAEPRAALRPPTMQQRQLSEFQALNQTSQKMQAVQQQISVMQAELVQLNARQVQLQSQMLDVQRRQLVVQEQQLVTQKISAIQLNLQTEMMQLGEVRQKRQRELKAAAFAIKTEVERLRGLQDAFVRLVWLKQLETSAAQAELNPSELEELGDKEYVQNVFQLATFEVNRAGSELPTAEQHECQWLLSGGERGAYERVAAIEAQIAVLRERILQARAQLQYQAQSKSAAASTSRFPQAVLSVSIGALAGLFPGCAASLTIHKPAAGAILIMLIMLVGTALILAALVTYGQSSNRRAAARHASEESQRSTQLQANVAATEAAVRDLELSAQQLRDEAAKSSNRSFMLLEKHPALRELGFGQAG